MKPGDDVRIIIDDAKEAVAAVAVPGQALNDRGVAALVDLVDLAERQQAALVRAARDLPPADPNKPIDGRGFPLSAKIEIQEDPFDPNHYVLIGPRPRPGIMGDRSWLAAIHINGEWSTLQAAELVNAMARCVGAVIDQDPKPPSDEPFTWAREYKPGRFKVADRPGSERTQPSGEGWFPLYAQQEGAAP